MIDFSLGVEKYWWVKSEFFRRASIVGFFNKRNTSSGSSTQLEQDWTEFGFGGNYHFYNTPFDAGVPVIYGGLTLGIGSLKTTTTTTVSGTTSSSEVTGSSSFFTIGGGVKYFVPSGIGAKIILDYYITNEKYEFNDGTTTEGSLSVPRIQVGLSYRF